MPDAIAFPLIGLIAAGLIALAMVWPQGLGAPSPAPFGLHHVPAASASLRGRLRVPVAPGS
jgi:hypothetical protein